MYLFLHLEPFFLNLQEKSQLAKKEERTRLDHIMSLKVTKPKITSTLANYQPRVINRENPEDKEPHQSEEETLFQCQQTYQKAL
jgi:hypothetical protein